MRIEVKGRGVQVTDELRECAERRFAKVDKQVSDLAVLRIELSREPGGSRPDHLVAEATLQLKGVTLRARDASRDPMHSVKLVSDELARQVKRHRDKRRNRREARAVSSQAGPPATDAGESTAAAV